MRLLVFLLCFLTACSACTATRPASETAATSPAAAEWAEDRLAATELEAHLRFLASDELMGREAGTPEIDVAARYLAEQLRAYGVKPVPGTDGYFQPVPLVPAASGNKALSSRNVAGLIEGHDPEMRDEYVLLTAHYDHVGAGLDKARTTPADSIFNGARDNAMGIVAVLAAAKALAQQPPARSVVLLLVTAEEMGLLGSRYYVDHPLVPLAQTRFVLNIDGAGYNDTGKVTVIGLDRTTAEPHLHAAVEAYGLSAISDPVPEQNLFDRSDNVSFAARGIPAPTFSPGFTAFDDELMKYYHQVADEVDEAFDFGYLLRFCKAYAHAARLIANDPSSPQWVAGDKYEAAANALYGTE